MKSPLCVIPAAGRGTRMGDLCATTPKCLLEVNGKPIIRHVVDFWKDYAERFVIVVPVGAKRSSLWGAYALSCEIHIVEDPHPNGVPGSVIWGLEAVGCPRNFMVALGDCLFDGKFEQVDLGDAHGVAVAESGTGDWDRSYAADLCTWDDVSGVRVRALIEKPTLGLGAFWLRWTALRALEETRSQSITETMSRLLWEDHPIKPVRFCGRHLNVTYKEDLLRWQVS